MLIGRYATNLDGKHRLQLPAHYCAALSQGAFVTQGFDRNLIVLKSTAFESLIERAQALNLADPNVRLVFRLIMSNAEPIQPDGEGRIGIPAGLAHFAGLEAGAVIVGQGNYFEIWAPDAWHAQELILDDAAANGARFKDLKVSQV